MSSLPADGSVLPLILCVLVLVGFKRSLSLVLQVHSSCIFEYFRCVLRFGLKFMLGSNGLLNSFLNLDRSQDFGMVTLSFELLFVSCLSLK